MESSRKQTTSIEDKIISQIEALPDYKYSIFSKFEDDMIKKYYPSKGPKGLAKVLGKTPRQVSNRAVKFGIRCS